ncbi:unnamed protein product [Nezara viridula]|uniref:Neuropeptide n=1 Tax=Nezara viridula TaxID=85310 RepID=A0A9P0MUX5_NEZVI|nr:unnamed protein product [Nezara viridula]
MKLRVAFAVAWFAMSEANSLPSARARKDAGCTSRVCLGSQVFQYNLKPVQRSKEELLNHAKDFLDQYFSSIRR